MLHRAKKGFFLGLILAWTAVVWPCGAQVDSSQADALLARLKDHPEEKPAQVALTQPASFKVFLDGKEVGAVMVAAGTEVDLLSITDAGLEVSQGANRATVAPGATDLVDRLQAAREKVQAAHETRMTEAAQSPATTLRLPSNSAPAEWYHAALSTQLDPWLVAYPDSPLLAAMKERRAAFAAEAARVAAGELRRGDQWIPLDEIPEWKEEIEAEALWSQIAGAEEARNGAALADLVPKVARCAKAGDFPLLVRATLEALDSLLPAVNSAEAKAALQARKDALAADKAKKVADLRAALDHEIPKTKEPRDGAMKWQDGWYRPPGSFVYAHHYGVLKPYYPNDDPTSVYPVLSDEELSRLSQEAKEVQLTDAQMAKIDAQMSRADVQAGQQTADLIKQREVLAQLPIDSQEAALGALPPAASLVSASARPAAKAALATLDKVWPGCSPAGRWRLDAVAAELPALGAALNAGNIAEALALQDSAREMIEAAPQGWPRAVKEKSALQEIAPALEKMKGIQDASARHDDETVLGATIDGASDGAKQWLSGLQDAIRKKRAEAHDTLVRAGKDLLHADLAAAQADYEKAKELWPENPELGQVHLGLQIAGLVGVLVVLGLLAVIWDRWSALVEHLRHRRHMKRVNPDIGKKKKR